MSKQLKIYIALGVGVLVLVAMGSVWYGISQNRSYLKSLGRIEALEQKSAADKVLSDAAITAKNAEIAQKEKALQASLSDAAETKKHDALITAKYDALKGEVAAAPPEALSRNINAHIGDNQSWPTAGGFFSFTRNGAERTLTLFYEGSEYRAKYENGQVTITHLEAAVSSAVTIGKAWEEKFSIQGGELANTKALYGAEHDARVHLQRSIIAVKIKYVFYGAVLYKIGEFIYNVIKEP